MYDVVSFILKTIVLNSNDVSGLDPGSIMSIAKIQEKDTPSV